ncbi:MAG: ketosteroid isomerase-related protein [Verrucomicrobiales bacterium]
MNTSDLIQNYYDAFNRNDHQGMLSLLAADVVHDINQSGSETGRDAFQRFLSRMDESYSEQVEDLVIMTSPDGARAAAEFYIRGKYLKTDPGLPEASGQDYYLRVGAFFEIADGKIARVTNYYDLADWVRQVADASTGPSSA